MASLRLDWEGRDVQTEHKVSVLYYALTYNSHVLHFGSYISLELHVLRSVLDREL